VACDAAGGCFSRSAGQSDTLTISVTAVRAGTALVAAADRAANPDPNPFNDLAVAKVRVLR